jgi:hypothetical protein
MTPATNSFCCLTAISMTALDEDPFGEVISWASFDVCFETRSFLV